MFKRLTAVLEDGSPSGFGIPEDPREPLLIRRGENLDLEVHIVTRAGVDVHVSGATVTLVAKRAPGSDEAVITKVLATDAERGPGIVFASIAPADYASAPTGLYVYDILMVNGDARDFVMPPSRLVVEGTTTAA